MLATTLSPMLASTAPLPVGDRWAYEIKWDGVRALVAVEGGKVRAVSRRGNDITGGYPELEALVKPLKKKAVLLDGELVALKNGIPDFGELQSRMHVRAPAPDLVASTPVTFVPFDVLQVGGDLVIDRPYDDRRALLDSLGLDTAAPFYGDGSELLDSTRKQGLEGLVAKQRDSRYLPGRRSDCWVKVKNVRRQSAVVGGWKEGAGGRSGQLGSLLLGVHSPEGLLYAGHVGTGFNATALAVLKDLLAPLKTTVCPYDGEVPREHARAAHWVKPEVVVDVDFTEWTRDGRLRHPSYKGIRDDIDPATVEREPQS
ncbi:MAG: polymerase LigD, ligase domain protein [Frankiales bacterium]|nr:polymerase LigD, ligase domain protein [Frankiales bacterium]